MKTIEDHFDYWVRNKTNALSKSFPMLSFQYDGPVKLDDGGMVYQTSISDDSGVIAKTWVDKAIIDMLFLENDLSMAVKMVVSNTGHNAYLSQLR